MAQLLKEIDKTEKQTEEKQQEEQEYLMPDGFGLNLDKIRELILKQNNINIPKDDPILSIVTILNAFLYEQQKLQEQYRNALTTVYQEVLDEFVNHLANGTKYEAGKKKEEKQEQETMHIELHKNHIYLGVIFLLATISLGLFFRIF